jgi:RHS repeat-associated protein
MGRLTQTAYPDGTTESSTYDAEGDRVTSTDRAGRITTYAYDPLKRLTETTFPDSASTSTMYDSAGEVIAVTDARGNETQYQYDNAGRRTEVVDALTHTTSFAYDGVGNQTSVTDANGNTTQYAYDNLNRRTRVTYPDSTIDLTAYDALGRTTGKTDQAGKTTQFQYDKLGRLTQVTDALSQVTKYGYDEVGERISQTDANSHTTQFQYDKLGRRTQRTLPLGMSETYSYDFVGNMTGKTDFNGKTSTYTYDKVNRLTSKVPDPSFGAPTVSFGYTPTGQRQSMVDASGTATYSYDVRDRLIQKATPEGTLDYTYDEAGNLTSIQSSNTGGTSVSYSFDQLNRLATVTDTHSGNMTYAYDNVGNLQGYLYPNGIQTANSYNTLNRLTNVAVSNNKAQTLASYAYTLGPAGNRTTVSEFSGRQVNYTYDDLYRLTNEMISGNADPTQNGSIGYQYDHVGNRLQRTSTLAAVPPASYSFDSNDRLSSDTYDSNGSTIASGGNNYSYDFENHLTSSNAGAVTIVYDGDGNRVAKTAGGVTTQYLVDDRNLTGYAQVLEELSGGAVQRVYTYGLNRISQSQASGTSFYGYDGHGSVRILTDTSGAVTDRYDYDAFGNVISQAGSTPNVYLYSGEQNDPNLNVYYLRARYYRADGGRFVSSDPADGRTLEPISLHKYVYAAANPINRNDPSGLLSLPELAVTTAIIGTLAGNFATTYVAYRTLKASVDDDNPIDGWLISLRGSASAAGGSVGGGLDIVKDAAGWWVAPVVEFGLSPLSIWKNFNVIGGTWAAGPIFNMNSHTEMEGTGFTASYPGSILYLLPASVFSTNKAWGALSQLAKNQKNRIGTSFSVGISTSGPVSLTVGLRQNNFGFNWSETGEYVPLALAPPGVFATASGIVNSTGSLLLSLPQRIAALASVSDDFFRALP